MDPKLKKTIVSWLAQYQAMTQVERSQFLETCRQRDPVAAQLMKELLAQPAKPKPAE